MTAMGVVSDMVAPYALVMPYRVKDELVIKLATWLMTFIDVMAAVFAQSPANAMMKALLAAPPFVSVALSLDTLLLVLPA